MDIFGVDNIVFGETAVFVQEGSGPPKANLLFEPDKIIQACNTSGEIIYEHGRDYEIQGRRLLLTAQSRIPFIEKGQMFPDVDGENSIGFHVNGKKSLLFSERDLFPNLQPRFTYSHANRCKEPSIIYSGKLPKLQTYLKSGIDFTFVVFGDSISVGANATRFIDIPPYISSYSKQLVYDLEKKFNITINFYNESVGGKSSSWGVESIDNVIKHKPNFVILAWGMNDASNGITKECFYQNIKTMSQKIYDINTDAEFLLVSTMCGNPDWKLSNMELYHYYRDSLLNLCADGIALADVTSVWEFMLERKRYIDMTGNGVNHPNDFGHMIYKNIILDVLLKDIL